MSDTSSSAPPSAGGGGTVEELFTSVPVDLFRSGNASGPRLDNIRDTDVAITVVKAGGQDLRMVSPEGGLSTFDGFTRKPGVKWWKIPKGTRLPATIRVVKDHWNRNMQATHYSLQPARLMTLAEYAEGLRELASAAIPMFTRPITQSEAQPGDEGQEMKVNKK